MSCFNGIILSTLILICCSSYKFRSSFVSLLYVFECVLGMGGGGGGGCLGRVHFITKINEQMLKEHFVEARYCHLDEKANILDKYIVPHLPFSCDFWFQ